MNLSRILFSGTSTTLATRPEGAAGQIIGRQVAVYEPPLRLRPDGSEFPLISKELVGRYLVVTAQQTIGTGLGPVTAKWLDRVDRFTTVEFQRAHRGDILKVIMPVEQVTESMAKVLAVYRSGLKAKLQEQEKYHKLLGESNDFFERALALLEAERRNVTDAEWVYLHTVIGEEIVYGVTPTNKEPITSL